MIRFLLNRPLGACVVAFSLMALGVITMRLLPVSLLPDIPVPEVTIRVNLPGADANRIEKTLTLPLRNQLLQLNHLDDLEAISQDGQATVRLRFDYGTDMDLAYLEANEKVDALMGSLPREVQRPIVIKAGPGDIPVFQLNVIPKSGDSAAFLEISELCENVLKRRLEQLDEVALVDLTGQAMPVATIRADLFRLQQAGIGIGDLARALESRNLEPGNVNIRDGMYEYSIRLGTALRGVDDLSDTYLKAGGNPDRLLRLRDVADVRIEEKLQDGLHTFNGNRAVGMAIIKKSDTQLLRLRNEVNELVGHFRKDYPSLHFELSQDQTELLTLSIDNLISSLLTGAALTLVMIFFFMKDRRTLFIIALVMPVSLTITMLGFYLLGISINIVSLAGLVLGVGEIIDSAIIIIENISQHRQKGSSLAEASADGTEEVIGPLFTSVLTNSAVFIPLLFLSGIAGALFFDQAIAVSLALGVSLLSSYTLVPVLYCLLMKKEEAKGETATMKFFKKVYLGAFGLSFRLPRMMFVAWAILLSLAVWTAYHIGKSGMPRLSHTEMELKIDWNEALSVSGNRARTESILKNLGENPLAVNAYLGPQQFLLNTRIQQGMSEAFLVIKLADSLQYHRIAEKLQLAMRQSYPEASLLLRPAQNVFEQLFRTGDSPLDVHVRDRRGQAAPDHEKVELLLERLRNANIEVTAPPERRRMILTPYWDRLALYEIEINQVTQALKTVFFQNEIGTLKADQRQIPILIGALESMRLDSALRYTTVSSRNGYSYPLNTLVGYRTVQSYASLSLGKDGAYVPLKAINSRESPPALREKISRVSAGIPDIEVRFSGTYFRDQGYLKELLGVLAIAIAMLFFILAAQFESLVQPFIVLLTILFGATGALIGLYLTGGSLNIMSGIGLIVLIGLLDNDSILKIDTMNRSRSRLSLMESIREGGDRRLQSQLMTYFTTVLGLLPILWSTGLGAELQRPLAISVVFGMTLGVFISWTFIPLLYYLIYNRKEKI